MRRIYAVIRRVPGVSNVWKLIDTGPLSAEELFAKYIDDGGAFGPSIENREPLPDVVDFGHEEFFPRLIARVLACELRSSDATDGIIIMNNGLPAGGAERQIVNTLQGLKRLGVSASFIGEYLETAPDNCFYLPALTAAGIQARAIERIARPNLQLFSTISRPVAEQLSRAPPHMLFEVIDMVRMLRRDRPRLLHLWQDETSIKHAISALIAGTPRIIMSGRNIDPTHFAHHRDFMRPAYRALGRLPQIAFSNNSHAGAKSYAAWLGMDETRFHVVHNGVDFSTLPPFSGSVRERVRNELGVGADADARLVLGVFRLATEKRPLLWLEVAKKALEKRPDLVFAIVGAGHLKPQVEEAAARLGVSERLRLIEPQGDIGPLYMAADAFLLTSEQEGLPNVVLEAQFYGRPVVATAVGGTPEAMLDGVTGRAVDSSDPSTLSEALIDVLDDEGLARSAADKGPAFVHDAFSVDRMIRDTLDLYSGA